LRPLAAWASGGTMMFFGVLVFLLALSRRKRA
jgi:MYXO-CTERM domain-containing protein